MQAGQDIAVRVRAHRPDGTSVRGTAVAAFFAPGRDPERNPDGRGPDTEAGLGFDAVTRTYGADVPTAGWAPGEWTVCGRVTGSGSDPSGWSWFRFTLEP
jgi:hypothetical protein